MKPLYHCLLVSALGTQLLAPAIAEPSPALQSETAAVDNTPRPSTMLKGQVRDQGLTSGTSDLSSPSFHLNLKSDMAPDDYRQLEFGITGFVAFKHLSDQFPMVTVIFPGCPAQKAGLQYGDVLLQANDHVFQQTDMQGEYWRILDGRAGTDVALTVRRGEQTLTVILTRMNIEDVEDPTLRRIFERMLRTLGPPIATPTASEAAPSS